MQVSAARDAIGDADFFLVARTDARGANAKYGLEVSLLFPFGLTISKQS